MTADRWTQAVRRQLGLGRLLPLGHPRDGAWIAEEAAEAFLRRGAASVSGVRLGTLRIALADPDLVHDPVVPPPPSALPPGPLRIVAEFTAGADPTAPGVEPLPTTAARLRATLAEAAVSLGLTVTEIDLKVTGLGDVSAPPTAVRHTAPRTAAVPTTPDEGRAATAALSVPGVLHLTDVLGHPVHIENVPGKDPALARRHVRVELAVAATGRTADVARAVRAAVADALPDTPSVTALVTSVE